LARNGNIGGSALLTIEFLSLRFFDEHLANGNNKLKRCPKRRADCFFFGKQLFGIRQRIFKILFFFFTNFWFINFFYLPVFIIS